MDDEKHTQTLRTYHQARTTAAIAGGIATFLAFAIFQIVGAGILDTAAWMFALGAMTFSGVFVASYLGYADAGKRTRVDAAA